VRKAVEKVKVHANHIEYYRRQPYKYDSIKVGLAQIPFGIASMIGSVIGGRLSDRALRANPGARLEARMATTSWAIIPLAIALVAYGWFAEFGLNVSVLIISLFVAGSSLM
jgi:MFS family permease